MSVEAILKEFLSKPDSLPYMIHESAFIEPSVITFSQDVRDACEANLCGMYGKCWSCPPGVGKWQELRDHYRATAMRLSSLQSTSLRIRSTSKE